MLLLPSSAGFILTGPVLGRVVEMLCRGQEGQNLFMVVLTPVGAYEGEMVRAQAASEVCRSVSHDVPACQGRHLERQCRLLCSVKGAWFKLVVLCPRKTCYSRVP